MQAWLTDLQQLLAHGDAAVLVTVARVEGSAPREAGTKMIVTREHARHTIGGGHLEWKAIDIARQVLRVPHARRLERLALGPSLGQCCGGAVVLAFERLDIADLGWIASLGKRLAAGASTVRTVSFASGDGAACADAVMLSEPEPGVDASDCLLWDAEPGTLLTETIAPNDYPVVVVGAGHVGAALIRVLATLPCNVRWVDGPEAVFPSPDALGVSNDLAARVEVVASDALDEPIDTAPPGTSFILATHDDARDLALAERILRRGDYLFFGMMGSRTKRQQFEHRLAALGIDPLQIARMNCPLGIDGIADKTPEVIAISAAAQLLRAIDARRHA